MSDFEPDDMLKIVQATVEGLLNVEKPLDVAKAKCIGELIQTGINTHKLKLEMAKASKKEKVVMEMDNTPGMHPINGSRTRYISGSGLGGGNA